MRTLLFAAAVSVPWLAGCSSQPAPQPRPGTLTIGTAQITVNGSDLGLTDQVSCTVTGHRITITTGTGQSGLVALVSEGAAAVAESVSITNLGGFTGATGSRRDAEVTVTGRSYTITGTADGFTVSQPAIQTSGTFDVEVAC